MRVWLRPQTALLRLVAAPIGTLSLLLSPRLIRSLPWRYILTLLRTQRETTVAATALALSVALTLLGFFYFTPLALSNLVAVSGALLSQCIFLRRLKRNSPPGSARRQ
jgi:hypothetical protein